MTASESDQSIPSKRSKHTQRLGFIGLGKMGRPMTENLLKAGFEVTIHNRSQTVVQELARQGATAAGTPDDVAAGSDLVLTCLPTPASVEEVYFGEHGLLGAAREGMTLVDCSTVGPELSRRIYAAAKERGAGFLDAPISGGPAGAQAASLTVMAGGDPETMERARPVFEVLGENIYHVGASGAGSVVKLVNQLLVAIHTAAAAEAVVFGVKAGADAGTLLDVLSTSYASSRMLTRCLPLIIDRQFSGGTPVELILKDLGLIQAVGAGQGTRLLLGSNAEVAFREALALGLGQEDMAALVKPVERVAGLTVRQ